MNPATLAQRWGVSDTTVYELLNRGELPGFRIGKLWRIRLADVEVLEAGPVVDRP
jgi:excisionase family DNA binding protein